jgi:ATP-dependent Clp protease adaptor protein ClpS
MSEYNPEEYGDIDELIASYKNKNLVLYNDNINSFQYVTECLIDFCKHDFIQAEQCAHIVHNNGKCGIKTGTYEELEPICKLLLNKGLSTKIE